MKNSIDPQTLRHNLGKGGEDPIVPRVLIRGLKDEDDAVHIISAPQATQKEIKDLQKLMEENFKKAKVVVVGFKVEVVK